MGVFKGLDNIMSKNLLGKNLNRTWDTKRPEKLNRLKMFFLENLVEDSRDGTVFDCDVLDLISTLEKKYEIK